MRVYVIDVPDMSDTEWFDGLEALIGVGHRVKDQDASIAQAMPVLEAILADGRAGRITGAQAAEQLAALLATAGQPVN